MIRRLATRRDEGFTLIELLIVIVILPVVVGAIALGLVTTFTNKAVTTTRLADSHDAQITSTYFVHDVTSAQQVSTSSGTASPTAICGTSSYLLGLSWSPQDGTNNTDSVIYTVSGKTLLRTACLNGAPTSSQVLAHGTFPPGGASVFNPCTQGGVGQGATDCAATSGTAYAAITVTCTDGTQQSPDTGCANNGLVNATPTKATGPLSVGVDFIKLSVLEYDSTLPQAGSGNTPFTFNVTASPQGWNAAVNGGGGGQANAPPFELLGPASTATFGGSSACLLNVNGVAAVNNSADGSVTLGSNATFHATDVYSQSSSPVTPAGSSPPVVVGPPLSDPYASLPSPPQPGDTPVTTNVTGSLSGQLDGIYILTKGLSLSGNTTLTAKPISSGGHGVLLYVPPSATGGIDLTGGGAVTLDQVFSGYDNISIWVANGGNVSLGGNGNTTTIGGIVYDPSGSVTLNGGGNGGGANAAGIVAQSMSCQGGGNGVGFSAGPLPTVTSLTPVPRPATDGQTVTLSASVTAAGNPVTSGNVVFQVIDKNGTTTTNCSAAAPLDNTGTASCTTAQLSAALSPYRLVATYQGTAAYGPSSDTKSESVLEPTTTTVSTNASNLVSGNSATFTATVSAADGSSPQGTVTFGGGVTCSGGNTKPLPATGPETVTCASGPLLAGNSPYSVTATYADSSNPQIWAGSTGSTPLTVGVATTTTTVQSSLQSSKPSQTVTFTATVAPIPDAGNVTWTFTGKDNTTAHCTGANYTATALNASGVATCQVSGGTFTNANAPYTVTAVYSGDASYTTSSGSVIQNIANNGSTTVGHAPTQSRSGQWTDSATVSANDGGTLTGTVSFYLCSGSISGCTQAQLTAGNQVGNAVNVVSGGVTSSHQSGNLTAGTQYCFAAVYSGDTNYTGSSDTSSDQCFTAT